jgi:hypothetical protein
MHDIFINIKRLHDLIDNAGFDVRSLVRNQEAQVAVAFHCFNVNLCSFLPELPKDVTNLLNQKQLKVSSQFENAMVKADVRLIKQVIQRLQDWGATAPTELQGCEENITFSLPKELRIQVTQA